MINRSLSALRVPSFPWLSVGGIVSKLLNLICEKLLMPHSQRESTSGRGPPQERIQTRLDRDKTLVQGLYYHMERENPVGITDFIRKLDPSLWMITEESLFRLSSYLGGF